MKADEDLKKGEELNVTVVQCCHLEEGFIVVFRHQLLQRRFLQKKSVLQPHNY